MFLNFSDETVICISCTILHIYLESVPFHKGYDIKCTENVSFYVIQVNLLLLGLLHYW